jgi:hypothetical protein
MSQYNPYEPPTTAHQNFPAGDTSQGTGEVPPEIVDLMRQTKPWVTFLGVLGLIGAGLMVLLGLFSMMMGGSRSGAMGAMGLAYVVIAVIYVMPSLHLLRYGSSIGPFLADPTIERLGGALGHQRSFWRFVGIMAIVMMVLYFLLFVGLFAFGASRLGG